MLLVRTTLFPPPFFKNPHSLFTGNGFQTANWLQMLHGRSAASPLGQRCRPSCCCCHPGHLEVQRLQLWGKHEHTQWMVPSICALFGCRSSSIQQRTKQFSIQREGQELVYKPYRSPTLSLCECDARWFPDVRVISIERGHQSVTLTMCFFRGGQGNNSLFIV